MKRSMFAGRAAGLVALAAMLLIAAAAKPATAVGSPAAPPNAKVYGKSLRAWLSAYWTWYYSTGQNLGYPTPGPFRPGPAPVVFLPMPGAAETTVIGGSWTADDPGVTQGEIHVTLPSGTGFVSPVFAWTAEQYADGSRDPMVYDDAMPNVVFNPSGGPGDPPIVTLDGKLLLRDFWSHYVPATEFPSPVVYPEPSGYGSVAAVAFQGAGMVVHPLPPGRHVMRIIERLAITEDVIPIPGISMGVIYDNTWIIDVVPPGKAR